ncbi:hypothetical protein V1478_010543 [Vespula squamosa]|uniref:Uncharacterized protein n=1 Tax=Vespula squamosa TaxID=30214 RepID=A0ABD2AIY7_VESSQ
MEKILNEYRIMRIHQINSNAFRDKTCRSENPLYMRSPNEFHPPTLSSQPTHPIVNGALPEIDSAAKDEFTERSEVATSLWGLLARNPHCYPRFVRDLDNKEKAYPLSKLPDSSSKYCDIANLTA